MVLHPPVKPSSSSTPAESRKKVRITGELYCSSSLSFVFFVAVQSFLFPCRQNASGKTKKAALAQQNKKFGRVDEHFMRQAEDNLYGELAVALGIARDEVPGYIKARVAQVKNAAKAEKS